MAAGSEPRVPASPSMAPQAGERAVTVSEGTNIAVAASPDGRTIAFVADGTRLQIVGLARGRPLAGPGNPCAEPDAGRASPDLHEFPGCQHEPARSNRRGRHCRARGRRPRDQRHSHQRTRVGRGRVACSGWSTSASPWRTSPALAVGPSRGSCGTSTADASSGERTGRRECLSTSASKAADQGPLTSCPQSWTPQMCFAAW